MTETEIKEQIIRIARSCGCTRVVLFGSRAKNMAHSRSDIDIAVWGNGEAARFFEFKDALEKEIPTLLRFDVVNMESSNISADLRSEIRKDGIVLYEEV